MYVAVKGGETAILNSYKLLAKQRRGDTAQPELEAWLLEAADKPTTPLTKSDFAAIRKRVRAKTAAA